jgi:hypothetical protein
MPCTSGQSASAWWYAVVLGIIPEARILRAGLFFPGVSQNVRPFKMGDHQT